MQLIFFEKCQGEISAARILEEFSGSAGSKSEPPLAAGPKARAVYLGCTHRLCHERPILQTIPAPRRVDDLARQFFFLTRRSQRYSQPSPAILCKTFPSLNPAHLIHAGLGVEDHSR